MRGPTWRQGIVAGALHGLVAALAYAVAFAVMLVVADTAAGKAVAVGPVGGAIVFLLAAPIAAVVGVAGGAVGGALLVPAVRRWGDAPRFVVAASVAALLLGLVAFPRVPLGSPVDDAWEVVTLKVMPAAFGAAAAAWHIRTLGR